MIAFLIIMAAINFVGACTIEHLAGYDREVSWRYVAAMWACAMVITACMAALSRIQGL